MAADPKLPIPVYFQLKTLLLEEILDGRYGPDGRLPTEYELCERHGISRTPVTRALSELATEGVVIRHRRRGTFVNPHWLHGHRGGPELRVIVPEGPWEGLIRRAAPTDTRFSVATVELHELHQALTWPCSTRCGCRSSPRPGSWRRWRSWTRAGSAGSTSTTS
jgi:DNA-binding GntR family transcriptional regulator